MSCGISITSVSGTGQFNGSAYSGLVIQANTTSTTCVTFHILVVGPLPSQTPIASTSVTSQALQSGAGIQILTNSPTFRCDADYEIQVRCLEGQNCQQTLTVHLDCPERCCPELTVVATPSACRPDGSCDVSFQVSGTAQAGCVLVFYLDFGNNDFTASQAVASAGPFSLTFVNNFPNAAGQTITAKIVDALHGECADNADRSFTFTLPDCTPDCCPKGVVLEVDPQECVGDCKRAVELTASFQARQLPCPPAFLEYRIFDSGNNQVPTTLASFTTDATSQNPNVQTVALGSSGSPYTVEIWVLFPSDCASNSQGLPVPLVSQDFTVEPCAGDQPCPQNLTFSVVSTDECRRNPDGKCCRVVRYTLSADHFGKCTAPNAETKFDLFMDGAHFGSVSFFGSGTSSASQELLIETGGTYNFSAVAMLPAGCPAAATQELAVTACQDSDCGDGDDDGDPTTCVLCTKCQQYLNKIGANIWRTVLCKALMVIFALVMAMTFASIASCGTLLNANNIPTSGANPGSILLGISFVLWILGFIVIAKVCGECCLWCAILFGSILSLIAIILTGIFAQGSTIWCVLVAILILLFLFVACYTSIRKRCDESL